MEPVVGIAYMPTYHQIVCEKYGNVEVIIDFIVVSVAHQIEWSRENWKC
jgi:hypothetical protein